MNRVFAVLPDQQQLTKPFIMKKTHEVNIKSFFQSNPRSSGGISLLIQLVSLCPKNRQNIGDPSYRPRISNPANFGWVGANWILQAITGGSWSEQMSKGALSLLSRLTFFDLGPMSETLLPPVRGRDAIALWGVRGADRRPPRCCRIWEKLSWQRYSALSNVRPYRKDCPCI